MKNIVNSLASCLIVFNLFACSANQAQKDGDVVFDDPTNMLSCQKNIGYNHKKLCLQREGEFSAIAILNSGWAIDKIFNILLMYQTYQDDALKIGKKLDEGQESGEAIFYNSFTATIKKFKPEWTTDYMKIYIKNTRSLAAPPGCGEVRGPNGEWLCGPAAAP